MLKRCSTCGVEIKGMGGSGKCKSCSQKGRIPWNKDRRGIYSKETLQKMSESTSLVWKIPECRKSYLEGFRVRWTEEARERCSQSQRKRFESKKERDVVSCDRLRYWKKEGVKKVHSELAKKRSYEGLYKEMVQRNYRFCLKYKDFLCELCGGMDSLQFHHLDSRNKRFDILTDCDGFSEEELVKEMNYCILVCARCHGKIHNNGYLFLVNKGRIENYIHWFLETQKLKIFEGYIDGEDIVKHHINTNQSNNNKKNLLFLLRSDHVKLHLVAYNYLVEVGEVKDYMIELKLVKGKDHANLCL